MGPIVHHGMTRACAARLQPPSERPRGLRPGARARVRRGAADALDRSLCAGTRHELRERAHDWRLMCGASSSEGAAKRERGKAAMGIHVRTIGDWRRLAREAQSSRRCDPVHGGGCPRCPDLPRLAGGSSRARRDLLHLGRRGFFAVRSMRSLRELAPVGPDERRRGDRASRSGSSRSGRACGYRRSARGAAEPSHLIRPGPCCFIASHGALGEVAALLC